MTAVTAPTPAARDLPAASPAVAGRLLAVFESEAGGKEIARYLAAHAAQPVEVVLLAVRPAPEMVRSRGVLLGRVVAELEAEGRAALAAAAAALAGTGIATRSEVAVTDDPAAVLGVAHREGCTTLVVAAPRAPAPGRFAALASAVASIVPGLTAIADVPVLVVPAGGRW